MKDFDVYDERKRGPLSAGLRKVIEDVVTGLDVPSSDVSISWQALDTLARELMILDVAANNHDCAEPAIMLTTADVETHLARLVVRARAVVQLTELLELQPDASAESEAAE
ncbi:MAG TPA: hypothetical protein VHB79_10415 [Polyangiaceae bacterium]|nr:hypothetical protein [Polyangiaceae bacterium]